MKVSDIENAIIERLKAKTATFKNIAVAPFPDKEKYALRHSAAVLVRYSSSAYAAPLDVGANVQERNLKIKVTLITKSLRDKNIGGYDLLDTVSMALSGFKIAGCKKIYLIADNFVDRDASIWEHELTFGVPTMHIEEPDEDELVSLSGISFDGGIKK